ncbi:hypothetical protein ICL81_04390 [Leucobacter sp. cx-328]|uniref:hypothetical protein n=1 Tax=unclassified Leucobacter TaxID=2621730 RepID=UPI00165E7645|nr:hypothetical protein [Leucobacter sp. cx-328]
MDNLVQRSLASLTEVRARLIAAEVQPEEFAEFVPERRKFLITRAARMRPVGQVWRLGTLLLRADDPAPGEPVLYAAGTVTRAAERGRPNNTSVSREERREIAAAALRGGYAAGTSVNYDAVALPLTEDGIAEFAADASLPVGIADGELLVRWRAGAALTGAPTLAAYLSERLEFLVHPPQGA